MIHMDLFINGNRLSDLENECMITGREQGSDNLGSVTNEVEALGTDLESL